MFWAAWVSGETQDLKTQDTRRKIENISLRVGGIMLWKSEVVVACFHGGVSCLP